MTIDIITLFPDTVGDVLSESIIGRGQERGYVRINCHQLRDYTKNKQKQVDDYPYGGGRGMVLQADPLFNCWEHICSQYPERPHTVLMSAQGKRFCQADALRLRDLGRLILVCGHYEGVDERFTEECVDEELSLGDFVLTGGEIPALAVADAVCRLVPGVLSDEECFSQESHFSGLLEYPQYSRPEEWHGRHVPPILLSGHHVNITRWRRKESLRRTMLRRPDMMAAFHPDKEDRKLIEEIERELESEREDRNP
ncbi:MAG: tRNA (guanosine(37)-N1)-methyltransferase TrmD [Oscillospiraceae bacterium]|nr:tRNA (guanosine(37)-N1)-methyltransferase TrmD [Oscillospiraceae bacterium]